MMNKTFIVWIVILFLYSVFVFQSAGVPAFADRIEDIKIVKISPVDQTAVVKIPGERLKLVRVGEDLIESVRITMISNDKLVIEHQENGRIETIIFRLQEDEQTIDRISPTPGKTEPLLEVLQGGPAPGPGGD